VRESLAPAMSDDVDDEEFQERMSGAGFSEIRKSDGSIFIFAHFRAIHFT